MNSQEKDMNRSSYLYDLPPELIASRPAPNRHDSRLMVYLESEDKIIHTEFKNLSEFLPENSTIVFNQSKVIPCRLLGKKESGGRAEIFVTNLEDNKGAYPCMIQCSGKKQASQKFLFDQEIEAEIVEVLNDGTFLVSFNREIKELLNSIGKIPIPPYIRKGISDEKDKSDYQTIYAKNEGSLAAPTAGLHFTEEVFKSLNTKNIEKAFVDLQVGLGTFSPVKVDNISEHKMHFETFSVEEENALKIKKANSLFAVGTTSLRVLESCYKNEGFDFQEGFHKTNIFLHPGVDVHSIDGLITNFHLPESTLLMLVSSIIGRSKTLELYQEAVEKHYRFFSYGDAMLIIRERQ